MHAILLICLNQKGLDFFLHAPTKNHAPACFLRPAALLASPNNSVTPPPYSRSRGDGNIAAAVGSGAVDTAVVVAAAATAAAAPPARRHDCSSASRKASVPS
eukprot:CAMPEP_0194725956 /NCGR_PEP_ID=MMETSP0296-20130528/28693_1 /TAXON_ID=39354 /ORGANISM="Heterosigma akashiwo, Strain CCMP2393" /LENGTH=101 /DNA_ID=CAMNT_0039630709 /DNA_START=93 /DNA_END=395 /DNA_ORIENTATION=+